MCLLARMGINVHLIDKDRGRPQETPLLGFFRRGALHFRHGNGQAHIGGNLRIAVMDPAGGNLRYLTDNWQDEAPTWAPNGRVIQFFRTTKGSGKTAIWQVDLTGRNERKLETPVDGSDPSWGPLRP